MRRNRAFTLIELLVVMAIIAILIICLLPALMSAQAASRRTTCINCLKQIDLALQSYHSIYNTLPSGCYDLVRPVSNGPEGYKVGWVVSILPFMEQNGIYNAFDFRRGADAPENGTARNTRISSLFCPSEGAVTNLLSRARPAAIPLAPGASSYAGCQNDVEAPIDEDNHGVLYLNSRVRFLDVSDGLSNTLFIGELLHPSSQGWVFGTRATLRNTGHPINGVTRSMVELAPPAASALPSELTAAELEQSIDSGTPRIAPTFVGGFGSTHHGAGANFAFGDGSVRFLRQTIDEAIYRRLGHRSDGELLDDDAY
jgi:prepilin-type N-terminal cleavage/methylation domain-containing protein/prepilin-type processing-associated H-X9-DG protein